MSSEKIKETQDQKIYDRSIHPIRLQIAEILDLSDEEKEKLNSISITELIERLMDYTKSLEIAYKKVQHKGN